MADARSSRLASTRLDSTLSTLCSHSIKNSPPLSWPSDALAYNVGAFFLSFRASCHRYISTLLPTIEPYHRLLQCGFSSRFSTCFPTLHDCHHLLFTQRTRLYWKQ